MADDAKARKLAAARKKLKAYQARDKQNEDASKTNDPKSDNLSTPESIFSEAAQSVRPVENPAEYKPSGVSSNVSVASLSKSNRSSFDSETVSINGNYTQPTVSAEATGHPYFTATNDLAHSNTIELLINEKANLCAELAHYKAESKEKTLAAEEANVRLQDALKRIENLSKDLLNSQSHSNQLQGKVESLSETVVQSGIEIDRLKVENVELRDHVEELKRAFEKGVEQVKVLEEQLKEKECELELSKIRINQISDVASVENDSKVEALTQTKFMHEQQIRDLQAMVQQLETEREQSNQQYQSYVQHLNKEMTSFTERNAKLSEENSQLVERERSLVEHVSSLEKQLQQMIAQQAKQLSKNEEPENDRKLLSEEEVEARMQDVLKEKSILLEKIQLQDVQIFDMQRLMNEKLDYIQRIEERLEHFSSLQSDSTKLLEKVESNSVAASRAMSQNEELKKQLDEVQTKLIQVTNDKVDLTNQLDAEKFANREIRMNYETMEVQISELKEKLHFKDEEMIRLTKENNELNSRIENIRHARKNHIGAGDEQIHESSSHSELQNGSQSHDQTDQHGNHDHHHQHEHSHDHDHDHSHDHNHSHDHDHNHDHDHSHNHDHSSDHDHNHDCSHDHDHKHKTEIEHDHNYEHINHREHTNEKSAEQTSPFIPQSEAMQKLETRFKSLMNDVANLTDEKQRLEHLVMQLQGETDTIGEYIALYQAQRRVLKQRELERNTQLMKLKSEREELHNKITLLNQLVNNLSQQIGIPTTNNNNLNVPSQQTPEQHISPVESESSPSTTVNSSDGLENQITAPNPKHLNSNQIIHAIQNIVANIQNTESTEIDLNVMTTLDHCSCCSGKFETI